jgi:hypothetical protein
MHKIKSVMGKRDDLYFLKGMVEFDEGYVRKATQQEVQKRLNRGKGRPNQNDPNKKKQLTLKYRLFTNNQLSTLDRNNLKKFPRPLLYLLLITSSGI